MNPAGLVVNQRRRSERRSPLSRQLGLVVSRQILSFAPQIVRLAPFPLFR